MTASPRSTITQSAPIERLIVVNGADAIRNYPAYPKNGQRWGNWQFKASTLVLEYKPADKHWWYEVDLERCSTSAGMLDWIFQVTNKSRHCLSTQDLGDLLEALNDLLRPQETLCSYAQNKRIKSVSKLIRGQMRASRTAIALSTHKGNSHELR